MIHINFLPSTYDTIDTLLLKYQLVNTPWDRIVETMTLDLACEKYLLSRFNSSF